MGKTISISDISLDSPSQDLCLAVLECLSEYKGKCMTCLDVSELTNIADFMIIVTATSVRHMRALAESLLLALKRASIEAKEEGLDSSEWALVDLGDIIVHIMTSEARELYALEELWSPKKLENQ